MFVINTSGIFHDPDLLIHQADGGREEEWAESRYFFGIQTNDLILYYTSVIPGNMRLCGGIVQVYHDLNTLVYHSVISKLFQDPVCIQDKCIPEQSIANVSSGGIHIAVATHLML